MVVESLLLLAGQTVVAAVATDAWDMCKRGFARLLVAEVPVRTGSTLATRLGALPEWLLVIAAGAALAAAVVSARRRRRTAKEQVQA